MLRPIVLLAVTLSAVGGWTVAARAQDAPSGKEGVTRPAQEGKDGVTRPEKPDPHDDHEHESPKSSAPT